MNIAHVRGFQEIQAITCSWCKVSYHNKENCYTLSALTEPCTLGAQRESIIPPPWILKLPSSTPNQVKNQTKQQSITLHPEIQGKEVSELLQSNNNLIDLSAANQPSAARNDIKENENVATKHQLQHSYPTSRVNNIQHSYQTYGSNTTLMTDTSGYMSADNSNLQSLISCNNNHININNSSQHTKVSNENQEKSKLPNECPEEIVVDPSSLQAADLSSINQLNLQQPLRERHQYPQENLNQFQKNQVKQYHRQIDANQNVELTKIPTNQDDAEDQTVMDYQLMHQQQQSVRQPPDGLYHNFRIVPHQIQGVPNAGIKPVLVFVNPRSGGNQGAKMMQKFNWLLNPRQVFDLIQSGGPRAALELYKEVPNLRILTIGGDGTASWILSYLDEVGIPNKIPVAVLPLGTGNDLARALGWGGRLCR